MTPYPNTLTVSASSCIHCKHSDTLIIFHIFNTPASCIAPSSGQQDLRWQAREQLFPHAHFSSQKFVEI